MATLTRTELETLKRELTEQRARLIGEIQDELERSGEQHYVDLAGRVADTGDEALADLLADVDAALIDRHVNELRAIDDALGRMDAGGFGVCVDCGQPIGFARLKTLPTALRCSACQDKHEKLYAHEGRPTL